MAEPKDHVVYEITSWQRRFRARLLSGSDELCKLTLEEIEVKEVVGGELRVPRYAGKAGRR